MSAIVVKAETGSAALFAFDEGQDLSEHTAPFDALVQVVDGEVAITISGKLFNLRTGDAIVMPANEPHAVKAIKRFKMLLTMIRAQGRRSCSAAQVLEIPGTGLRGDVVERSVYWQRRHPAIRGYPAPFDHLGLDGAVVKRLAVLHHLFNVESLRLVGEDVLQSHQLTHTP